MSRDRDPPVVRRRRPAASAASLFDPALRFRALPTEHFVIYFHQGEDRAGAAAGGHRRRHLARPRAAARPDAAAAGLRIVLADQTELFNGYATPVPLRHGGPVRSDAFRLPTPISTTGCGCCSLTSSRTSSISIDRRAGRGWCAWHLRTHRHAPSRICSCRSGKWRAWPLMKRVRSRGKAASMPASSAPSSARRHGSAGSSRSTASTAA